MSHRKWVITDKKGFAYQVIDGGAITPLTAIEN
jgi:hypothetical protein